jgi:hypothetical protein
MKILLTVTGYPTLDIVVNDTETGRRYFELCQKHMAIKPPVYRDSSIYSVEYMQQLAQQAEQAFGWQWSRDSYHLGITAQLHKDLERLLSATGFQNIPEEYDNLLYDLHHCLHAIQTGKTTARTDYLQLEWLTDDSSPLPADFEFAREVNIGDLILINPYVGHNPEQIYRENDWTSLSTTCRFHDIIKPAVVLVPFSFKEPLDAESIVDAFEQHDPEFVAIHGRKKIARYTGLPVIGHTNNTEVFKSIYRDPSVHTIESLEFVK